MATKKYDRNKINHTAAKRTRETVTNTEWNERWNLGITQGNALDEFVYYLGQYLFGTSGFDDTVTSVIPTLSSGKEDKSTANLLCATINYVPSTGVFTFKDRNGDTMCEADLNIEKIPSSIEVKWLDTTTTPSVIESEKGWYLIITNTDGSYTKCPVGTLFNDITFTPVSSEDQGSNITFHVTTNPNGSKTVKAKVTASSITTGMLDSELSGAFQTAKDNAEKAEGFAVGQKDGADVPSSSPYYQNNAKYYNTQAQSAKEYTEGMTVAATTLPAGSSATVTKTTEGESYKLTFGLPTGAKGDKGDDGAIQYTAGTGISISANHVISNTQTSANWGNITGTLSNQTDLQTALDAKQDTLTSGVNIKTINSTSLLGSGNIDLAETEITDSTTGDKYKLIINNGVLGIERTYEAPKPLCFTANTAGSTIAMSVTGTPTLDQNFAYSTDSGSNWLTFTPGTTTVTLTNVGDKVYFKGDNPNGVSESSSIYYKFVMTGSIAGSGNIMSLIDNGAFNTLTIPNSYCYYRMFYNCTSLTTPPTLSATTLAGDCYRYMFYNCTSLVTAPILPATTLATNCYGSMFSGCTSLTTAPALPATTLAGDCYNYMFHNCTSLTTAPALPATTLATYCYASMFEGCTSLTTAPTLPATTLAEDCYCCMFYNCASLTTPPALPATTLATYCYGSMFHNCTSLVTAPILPATTLATNCYSSMFSGCTSLTTAPALPATTLATSCYSSMFSGCTSLTTAPALPATTLTDRCYVSMFEGCTSLIVSDASGTGYDKAWTIPSSGTFTNTYSQSNLFYDCATGGGRSSDDMAGGQGQSYTYYTQNEPV